MQVSAEPLDGSTRYIGIGKSGEPGHSERFAIGHKKLHADNRAFSRSSCRGLQRRRTWNWSERTSQIGPSNDGIFVHGARSYDNNWQLDGISVSDVMSSGSISGGIPIPNPDTLEEFKVQTGLYDASFGRGAGANVSVITKSGTNVYPRDDFRVLAQQCSQRQRLLSEPNWPATAEPQAEPVRICARRTQYKKTSCFSSALIREPGR